MWLLIIPIFLGVVSFNFPFVYWPEMLNWPFVMARGFELYRDFSIVHTPGLPLILLLLNRVLGESPVTLHIFGSALLIITDILVGYLVCKNSGLKKALLAQIFYGFVALAFGANSVWFDLMLAPLTLLIYPLATSEPSSKKLVLLGVLFGLMFWIKQTSVYLLPVIVFATKFNIKKLLYFSTAYVSILSTLFFFLYSRGILPDFINWAVRFVFVLPFIKDTSGTLTPDLVLPTIKQTLVVFTLLLALLVNFSRSRLTANLYLLTALLFSFPRFEYFHLVPFAAVFTVYIFGRRIWPLFFVIPAVAFVFVKTWQTGDRFLTLEVYAIADEIKTNYSGSSIFSLNGPDLVYYLSNKPPAFKPWIDQLSWHLAYADKEFTSAFLNNPSDVVVYKPYLDQPFQNLGAYKPRAVYDFVMQNYVVTKTFPDKTTIMVRK